VFEYTGVKTMKNNHFKRFLFSFAIAALISLMAVNVYAEGLTTNTAGIASFNRNSDDDNFKVGEYSNNFIVASPYWQVDSGSYTFIAVSHSSLSGMASQIGVRINAITSTGENYDTAETFTISSGSTERVFIVPTNHATINSTTVSDAKFLAGTSNYTYGHIRVNPVASHPQLKFFGNGGYNITPEAGGHRDNGAGLRDITMLTYWGSVIIEANTTGFAMEFVGDLNDSQAPYSLDNTKHSGSGVNIQ
jgi:hypothetical protein